MDINSTDKTPGPERREAKALLGVFIASNITSASARYRISLAAIYAVAREPIVRKILQQAANTTKEHLTTTKAKAIRKAREIDINSHTIKEPSLIIPEWSYHCFKHKKSLCPIISGQQREVRESKNREKYVEASVTPNEVTQANKDTASKADYALLYYKEPIILRRDFYFIHPGWLGNIASQ
ncbi:uncharacterized protein CIMG_03435 [Coccidioides immitis RS]|uniref:Uncharacterized protein n=3 Tax=Coccidioides immitis TaxID=5501 RepID=J3KBC6_COCIM|nr:uncharacterized protein CIMG_03435 [Coccidioides immitis RS]EAS32411.3 hypothetical protein CIMG_03435 [Coccidioides immitis RS]KMP07644.1 hypothetical protein CIRG_07325 [Coccidioides immitis RMSCC 2394]KMU71905.1 hypothetical protein CISG_00214 [Coccidioides immitis RMSCC 3703]